MKKTSVIQWYRELIEFDDIKISVSVIGPKCPITLVYIKSGKLPESKNWYITVSALDSCNFRFAYYQIPYSAKRKCTDHVDMLRGYHGQGLYDVLKSFDKSFSI